MAEGAWNHTAAIAAYTVQMHAQKKVTVTLEMFNPYTNTGQTPGRRKIDGNSGFFKPPGSVKPTHVEAST